MTSAAPSLQDKFHSLGQAMKPFLVERNEEIDIVKLALASKHHAFLLGDPGVAKSMLIETAIRLIDGLDFKKDYFKILFMKSTVREDVFGPLSLPLLKEGRYKYNPEGFLPEAKVVFGDEFWKANAGIQNALLWATNEREYRNDGQLVDLPLWSMFIASNEMPGSDELNAIFDRFALRKKVIEVAEPGNFMTVLKQANQLQNLKPVIHWDDIQAAHLETQQVTVPDVVLEAVAELRVKLQEANIFPSTRRFVYLMDIVRANAWLDGETEADIFHLMPGKHVLWSNPEDAPAVETLLSKLSNPLDLEVRKIQDDISKVNKEADKLIAATDLDELQRKNQGTSLFDKVESASHDLKDASLRAGNSKRRTNRLDDAKDQLGAVTRKLLIKVFHIPEDQINENVKELIDIDGEVAK